MDNLPKRPLCLQTVAYQGQSTGSRPSKMQGIKGNIAQTMAVFTLKQLGWRDNIEVKAENTNRITIINDLENE